MSDDLERRYARLLRLYPAEYRRARGAELLETLMESTEDGRKRPALREVAAIVLGALRLHAGREHRESVKHSWLAAFRPAALMLLVYGTANTAVHIALGLVYFGPTSSSPTAPETALTILALAFGLYAVVAVLRGRYRSAAVVASTAFLLTLPVTWPLHAPSFGDFWMFPLAVGLLLPLLKHRPLPIAGLLRYAPMAPLLLIAAEHGMSQAFPDIAGILQRGVLVALCAGGLVWLAVDERVAMALGLLFLGFLIQVALAIGGHAVQNPAAAALSGAVAALWPTLLLSFSAITARRQARL